VTKTSRGRRFWTRSLLIVVVHTNPTTTAIAVVRNARRYPRRLLLPTVHP
jgi:hypothetical protein